MSDEREPVLRGGCQCGAVRYALYSEPPEPSICQCRMCQKAFGNYFAPLAGVPMADLAWTKGYRANSAAQTSSSAVFVVTANPVILLPRQGWSLRLDRQP